MRKSTIVLVALFTSTVCYAQKDSSRVSVNFVFNDTDAVGEMCEVLCGKQECASVTTEDTADFESFVQTVGTEQKSLSKSVSGGVSVDCANYKRYGQRFLDIAQAYRAGAACPMQVPCTRAAWSEKWWVTVSKNMRACRMDAPFSDTEITEYFGASELPVIMWRQDYVPKNPATVAIVSKVQRVNARQYLHKATEWIDENKPEVRYRNEDLYQLAVSIALREMDVMEEEGRLEGFWLYRVVSRQ